MKSIHPFPARMAPEIALTHLGALPHNSVVLDPMVGSGTVLRQAAIAGYRAIGYDLDPLAVLLSSVWASKICPDAFLKRGKILISEAKKLREPVSLKWMDDDKETSDFIDFWFAEPQKMELRKIAYILQKKDKIEDEMTNALKVAVSRLIITKHKGASLAWDVSHSRPHKVRECNDFNVFLELEKSINFLAKRFSEVTVKSCPSVYQGDARHMKDVENQYVDAIFTSPPYLNAIDYLRGHKLALVWFGYTLADIRNIRMVSIGVERRSLLSNKEEEAIAGFATNLSLLPSRHQEMIKRYAGDALLLMREFKRVIKPEGKIILVVGNSCLKGQFVENSKIFELAAASFGFKTTSMYCRPLPSHSRYLPIAKSTRETDALSKRMREEIIMTFG